MGRGGGERGVMIAKSSEVEPVALLAAKQALLEKRLMGLRSGTAQSRIPRFPRQSPAPLSFAQQRLWFLDQVQPGNPAYNLLDAWRLQGPLNSNFLEQAFNEVLRRHEALRTTFAAVQGQPVQVVAPAQEFRLKQVDLRAIPAGEREKTFQRFLSEEARRPFDLTWDLLVRGTLFCLGDDEHALLVTMHHIISDAWSLGVL